MFSDTIRELRRKRDISQKELAQAVFISPAAISQYEQGKCRPSHETLEQLAAYFEVSVDYLMGSSRNSEMEKLLNEQYVENMRVSELLEKLVQLNPEEREAVALIVRSMAAEKEKIPCWRR